MDFPDPNSDFWLFGYGSLLWKLPPHYDQRLPGYIKGYVRRFWQASEDHRGTPSSPGRVVTLIDHAHYSTLTDPHRSSSAKSSSTANDDDADDDDDETVWGAAYHVPAVHAADVMRYLDIREQNGYSVQYTTFYKAASAPTSTNTTTDNNDENKTLRCLVYIGLPSNPQFVGPQDPQALAAHILASRGPSGDNIEYLLMLEEALKGLCPAGMDVKSIDFHVSDLARRCRELMAAKGEDGGVGGKGATLNVVESNDDELEEIEK